MKKILNLLILCILIINISCSQNQKQNQSFIYHYIHQKFNYVIPDSLYDFFPKESNKVKLYFIIENAQYTDIPFYNLEYGPVYILKGYEYLNKHKLNKTLEKLNKDALYKFISTDTNYFVIASERNIFSKFDTAYIIKEYLTDKLLIPGFFDIVYYADYLYDSITKCGLKPGYEIVVLKLGYEYVLPEKYKVDWDLLPDSKKHGYMSGIAYTKLNNEIIYWVMAW